MNGFKWFMPVMAIVMLVAVLVGFWYLQGEINSLRTEPETPQTINRIQQRLRQHLNWSHQLPSYHTIMWCMNGT
jgi:uncharacterized membrane protein